MKLLIKKRLMLNNEQRQIETIKKKEILKKIKGEKNNEQ